MPDVTLVVKNIEGGDDVERLERLLSRLDFVRRSNVDGEKGLVAVSFDGGGSEFEEIEAAIREAGFECEATPGSRRLEK